MNSEIIDKFDEWAHRLGDKVLEKEFISIPYAVQALACIYHLAKVVKEPTSVVTRTMAHQLLDNYISEGGGGWQ